MTDHPPPAHTHSIADHGAHHRGFQGPKCWVVSTVVGIVLGLVSSVVLPARAPASHADDHEPIIVVQTRPDGSQHIRNTDETSTPLSVAFDAGKPETIAPLVAAAAAAKRTAASDDHRDGSHGEHGASPDIPLVLCIPFVVLLLSIALMPFISEKFWHAHFPDFAFLLGAMVATYYLAAFGDYGRHEVVHAAIEYYAFIALVGGLYVASGGILIDIRARGRPITNAGLLALGAVLANIVGTTGASVLLIRPFMRMNHGRLRAVHMVFFIFIVSNCGGCLTPIGDPPLYLGYLKGVPFFWTVNSLWPMWLVVNGMLLTAFMIVDSRMPAARPSGTAAAHGFDRHEHKPIITGWTTLGFLALLVAGVFIDPAIKRYAPSSGLVGIPVGATFQIIVAAVAYFTSRPSIHHANQFTFGPVKEVGFLFIGIFLTMAPALGYLRANAVSFGLESPTQFYFGTGILSAFLDNAPTYLSFGQVALGVLHLPLNPAGIAEFISGTFDIVHPDTGEVVHFHGQVLLEAISLAAVFFGAMTYIGNGPNFMVKSIVEAAYRRGDGLGVRMPSFFGYLLLAVALLLPVIIVNWLIFIR